VYVTHDQNEAMELGHRVAVMGGGRVRQLGTPEDVYLRPTSRYVANFVGTSNELRGTVTGVDGAEATVDTPIGEVRGAPAVPGLSVGAQVVASFRPENVALTSGTADGWHGTVERTLFLGPHSERIVRVGDESLRVVSLAQATSSDGDHVTLSVPPSAVRVLPLGEDVT
jgi:iron(III) transport system ATP-binding protein